MAGIATAGSGTAGSGGRGHGAAVRGPWGLRRALALETARAAGTTTGPGTVDPAAGGAHRLGERSNPSVLGPQHVVARSHRAERRGRSHADCSGGARLADSARVSCAARKHRAPRSEEHTSELQSP